MFSLQNLTKKLNLTTEKPGINSQTRYKCLQLTFAICMLWLPFLLCVNKIFKHLVQELISELPVLWVVFYLSGGPFCRMPTNKQPPVSARNLSFIYLIEIDWWLEPSGRSYLCNTSFLFFWFNSQHFFSGVQKIEIFSKYWQWLIKSVLMYLVNRIRTSSWLCKCLVHCYYFLECLRLPILSYFCRN